MSLFKLRALVFGLLLPASALAQQLWYVNGVTGIDTNTCQTPATACKTIGHAVSQASSGDSIIVAPDTYPENLTIGFSLNLIGSGASTTIIDGGGRNTVVTIPNTGSIVTLSNLTFQHGSAQSGGGISNRGILTINSSTISGNTAFTSMRVGGLGGGGILNSGTLTINNSTLSGNSAGCGVFGCADNGGAVLSYCCGAVSINNSTLNGNTASGHFSVARGGAIAIFGPLSINNGTLSGNSAMQGGGVYVTGSATVQNTILASNGGGNCSGSITSKGYNLSSDTTCNFAFTGDLNNTNPMLGPLQYNGGTTETMALLSGSPAIDAGNHGGCTDGQGHLLTTDQRGMPRPDTGETGCDIGAFESQN